MHCPRNVCMLSCLWHLPINIYRVGQNRIYTPYMTVYLMKSLQKRPYIHMVLANPKYLPKAPFRALWHPPTGDFISTHRRLYLYPQATSFVPTGDFICTHRQLYLYPQATLFVPTGDFICTHRRLYLYPQATLSLPTGDFICTHRRLLFVPTGCFIASAVRLHVPSINALSLSLILLSCASALLCSPTPFRE